MTYNQSAYIAGNYQIEASENTKTKQVRAISPLLTLIAFHTESISSDGTKTWLIDSDVIPKTLWIIFPSTPSGTITLGFHDYLSNNYHNLILDVTSKGLILDKTWIFEFPVMSMRLGERLSINPSAAISKATLWGEPSLITNTVEAF